MQFGLGQDAGAAASLSEASTLFAQLEDPVSQADSSAKVALARERLGDWNGARDAWTTVLQLRQALDDPHGELEAREGLARATRYADPSQAIGMFDQALALATVLGASARKLALHNTLGILHWEREDYLASFRHYDAALRVCRQTADRVHEGLILNCVGLALTRLQRYDEARTVLEESAELNRETCEPLLEAHALAALADVSLRIGGSAGTRDLLQRAAALREQLGDDAAAAELRRRLAALETAAH